MQQSSVRIYKSYQIWRILYSRKFFIGANFVYLKSFHMLKLPDHIHAAYLPEVACSTAWCSISRFMSILAIGGQMPIYIWVGCSKIWQNTSEANHIHCVVEYIIILLVLFIQNLRLLNISQFYAQNTRTKYTEILILVPNFPLYTWYCTSSKNLARK